MSLNNSKMINEAEEQMYQQSLDGVLADLGMNKDPSIFGGSR